MIGPFLLNNQDDVVNVEDTNSSTSESSTEEKSAGKELFPPIRGEFDSTEEVSSAKKGCPLFFFPVLLLSQPRMQEKKGSNSSW